MSWSEGLGGHDSRALGIDRRAPTERIALGEGGTCWVDLTRAFVREPAEVLAELSGSVTWQQGETWRYDRWVEERRLGASVRHEAMPGALRQARAHLDARYRVRFGGAAVILYRDGNDFQGLHTDREMRWLDDTLIAIAVLGERRPFVLRPRRDWTDPEARRDASEDVVLLPGHGDLLVMGGRSQREWLHGVPAAAVEGPRVSIIWRWTSRRGAPDTAPGYNEGRHFSDRRRPGGRRTRPV